MRGIYINCPICTHKHLRGMSCYDAARGRRDDLILKITLWAVFAALLYFGIPVIGKIYAEHRQSFQEDNAQDEYARGEAIATAEELGRSIRSACLAAHHWREDAARVAREEKP